MLFQIKEKNLFGEVQLKDKNRPIDIFSKSQTFAFKIDKLTKNLQHVARKELTFKNKTQEKKIKNKEENFVSKLDSDQKKKFLVKKKLLELISPLDKEEERLEQMILSVRQNISDNKNESRRKSNGPLLNLRGNSNLFNVNLPNLNKLNSISKNISEEELKIQEFINDKLRPIKIKTSEEQDKNFEQIFSPINKNKSNTKNKNLLITPTLNRRTNTTKYNSKYSSCSPTEKKFYKKPDFKTLNKIRSKVQVLIREYLDEI